MLVALTITSSPTRSTEVTPVFNLKLNLRSFFSTFLSSLPKDLSILGMSPSAYSITVTSAPNLPYTEPNSKPITPPPITIKRLGTSVKLKASVEVIILSLSTETKGNDEGFEPVAIMVLVASI